MPASCADREVAVPEERQALDERVRRALHRVEPLHLQLVVGVQRVDRVPVVGRRRGGRRRACWAPRRSTRRGRRPAGRSTARVRLSLGPNPARQKRRSTIAWVRTPAVAAAAAGAAAGATVALVTSAGVVMNRIRVAPAVALAVDCADRVAIRGARLHAVIVEARRMHVGQPPPVRAAPRSATRGPWSCERRQAMLTSAEVTVRECRRSGGLSAGTGAPERPCRCLSSSRRVRPATATPLYPQSADAVTQASTPPLGYARSTNDRPAAPAAWPVRSCNIVMRWR